MIFNAKLNEFAARIAVENVPFPIKTPKEYGIDSYANLALAVMNGEHIDGLHPTHDLMEATTDNFNIAIQTIEELTLSKNSEYLKELISETKTNEIN